MLYCCLLLPYDSSCVGGLKTRNWPQEAIRKMNKNSNVEKTADIEPLRK